MFSPFTSITRGDKHCLPIAYMYGHQEMKHHLYREIFPRIRFSTYPHTLLRLLLIYR